MLAMHYLIDLAGPEQIPVIRRRAGERGPLFDGMAGLAHKLFLLDEVAPAYATFYLWRDPVAALDFLEGDLFRALSESFGRPTVQLLLSRLERLEQRAGQTLSLNWRDGAPVALDPRDGRLLSFAPGPAARNFTVLYHAAA
jgi:hypothetical protein